MINELWFVLVGVATLFIGLALAFALVGGVTEERTSAAGRSLEAIEALTTAPRALQEQMTPSFSDRVVEPLFTGLAGVGRRITPASQRDKIRMRLDQAGNPVGWDVERVAAFKVLAAILVGLLALVVPLLLGYGVAPALGLLALGAVLGFFVPNLLLKGLVDSRSEQIQRDLPNALDLLTISVEAGLSFDAALAQVSRNTQGPLADEFTRVLQEMQIGMGRTAAIRAMGERSAVPDLQSFASAMVQADEFGIPIAEVLRVQAKEMRVKRRQRAEERAMKVPVKILFPLIFCIMPAIFIVILGPGIILIRDSLLFN
jgi:tight adherence protein C